MTGRKRIDPETADKIRQVIILSRSHGQDPVTALDAAGLLRHRASKDRDLTEFMDKGIIPGVQNLRVPPGTKSPLDMKRVIVEALEKVRDDIQTAQ